MPPRDRTLAFVDAALTSASPVPASASPGFKTAPVAPSEITVKMLRDAIPTHCFKHSLALSCRYVVQDLAMIAILALAVAAVENLPLFDFVPAVVKYTVVWPLYWWWQGAVMAGVWILAHEYGALSLPCCTHFLSSHFALY
jgi:hypothetical protein